MAEFTKSCKRCPLYNDLRNLAFLADDLTEQILYRTIFSQRRLVGTVELYNVRNDFAPYSHNTVLVQYRAVMSRCRQEFACHMY
jgi:hypothetical protein